MAEFQYVLTCVILRGFEPDLPFLSGSRPLLESDIRSRASASKLHGGMPLLQTGGKHVYQHIKKTLKSGEQLALYALLKKSSGSLAIGLSSEIEPRAMTTVVYVQC